jgi:hypothetical protein
MRNAEFPRLEVSPLCLACMDLCPSAVSSHPLSAFLIIFDVPASALGAAFDLPSRLPVVTTLVPSGRTGDYSSNSEEHLSVTCLSITATNENNSFVLLYSICPKL